MYLEIFENLRMSQDIMIFYIKAQHGDFFNSKTDLFNILNEIYFIEFQYFVTL